MTVPVSCGCCKSSKSWWLETTELASHGLEARRSNEGVRGLTYLQGRWGSSIPGFVQPLMDAVVLGLWLLNSSLCLQSHVAFSSVSVSSPFLSLRRTLLIGFRAHPDIPDHLISRSLI